ncbi:MAG: type III-B CRISPR module RAMP protein Cmr1 [Methanothrix sp.]
MKGSCKEWRCRAITPIWTGDADRKGDRLIPSGLLGSVRWWFEVLVRGLGGSACDPTDPDSRCLDKQGHRCVVCELFGCTGWARKFQFKIVDGNGQPIQAAISKGQEFVFYFTPLRPIREEEWALLDLTLRLIADYGAIGGRTVFKPSDEKHREDMLQHRDYGLIEIISRPQRGVEEGQLRYYVKQSHWRNVDHGDFAWASLTNLWCVKGRHLARQSFNRSTFNKVIGRKEDKNKGQTLVIYNETNKWLAGRQHESKKVFSFRHPQRTFGFVKPDVVDFDEMKKRLREAWLDLKDDEFCQGPDIFKSFIRSSGGAP